MMRGLGRNTDCKPAFLWSKEELPLVGLHLCLRERVSGIRCKLEFFTAICAYGMECLGYEVSYVRFLRYLCLLAHPQTRARILSLHRGFGRDVFRI